VSEPTGPPFRCRGCGKAARLRADDTVGAHNGKDGRQCDGSYHPPAGDPPCMPTCRPVGTMAWPPEYVKGQSHASTHVCDSPAHQDEASRWVYGITGHAGVFRTFAETRAAG
jgi:hypothetical protein